MILAGVFTLVMLAASADLVLDRPSTLWSIHVLTEGVVVVVSLGAAAWLGWGWYAAERETALMLLKGHSHKRIGRLTGRSERTVRQHAVAVYRKSGCAGRSELAAFFLEGLLLPEGTPLTPSG